MTTLQDLHGSIFLAGPCPRVNFSDDWRNEAYQILDKLGFSGTVISPTNPNYKKLVGNAREAQTTWERNAMHAASAIVFWIPRSEKKPARTTNIEFGEWYKKSGVFVGWPDGAIHNEYLDCKLKEQNKQHFETLVSLLDYVVSVMKRKKPSSYFTSDTHFKQQRTLELSRRPFVNVAEMDLTMLSNWNKTVSDNDIVYHAGDFIDPAKITHLEALLNDLNFKQLHWTLGNYDRKIRSEIEAVIKKIRRPVFLYDVDAPCHCVLHSGDKEQKFVIAHEPVDFAVKADPDEIVLYGHIHGRAFAKRNGFDLATDYHRYTPISESDVMWFANAMNYWDQNVFTDQVKIA